MLEKIIESNVLFLRKYISCSEEQAASYKYGLQILYVYLIDISALFSLAYLFGRLYETVLMIFIFAVLQVFGGGYHAESQIRCFCIMVFGWIEGITFICSFNGDTMKIAIMSAVICTVIFFNRPCYMSIIP